MADKVLSVRTDDDTIARLNQIAESSGLKKADLLPELLAAYEQQQAASALPGRKDEIDHMCSLLHNIKSTYITSLQLAASAKAEAAAAVAAEAEAAKNIQATLQARIDELGGKLADAEAKAAESDKLQAELDALQAKLAEAEQARAKAEAERSEVTATMARQINDLTARLDAQTTELAAAAEQAKELTAARIKMADMTIEAERERNNNAAAVLAVRAQYVDKIDSLQARLQSLLSPPAKTKAGGRKKSAPADKPAEAE